MTCYYLIPSHAQDYPRDAAACVAFTPTTGNQQLCVRPVTLQ